MNPQASLYDCGVRVMAERRFISKQIFNDDIFTDLEVQARLLYAYLILNADDDGFLKNTKQMMFLSGADINDLQTLVSAGYLYEFPSGAFVIRHWNMMNKVQPTRKSDTIYQNEKSELTIINDVYCRQDVDKVSTQGSIGQGSGSIGQDSTEQASIGKGRAGQGKEGKDTSSSPSSSDDIAKFEKVRDYQEKHPECSKLITAFQTKIKALRDMDDFVLICMLYETYGKDALADAMVTTIKEGGKSVQYLAGVCKKQNAEPERGCNHG